MLGWVIFGRAMAMAMLCYTRINCQSVLFQLWFFYRTMHFSAKRGIAIACRLSVRLSVRLWRWWIVIT